MYYTGMLIWLCVVVIVSLVLPFGFWIVNATKSFINREELKRSVYMKFMIDNFTSAIEDDDDRYAQFFGMFLIGGAILSLIWPVTLTAALYMGTLYYLRYKKEKEE